MPAFKQHFLDQAQTQWETEIEPDCMCNDLRRKSVAFITDRTKGHAPANIIRTYPARLT
jgi:hypothetical protein